MFVSFNLLIKLVGYSLLFGLFVLHCKYKRRLSHIFIISAIFSPMNVLYGIGICQPLLQLFLNYFDMHYL